LHFKLKIIMKKNINPFLTKNYISKEYFCNREKEIKFLYDNVKNGINTTLISPRRLGKTGLIYRFFEFLSEKNNMPCIYADVYATRNLSEFINVLAEAVLRQFPEKTGIGKKFMKVLKGMRPVLTFDALTGFPQVQFLFQSENEKETTLQKLLHFIDSQSSDVVVALDEFQQIAEYPETNVEAMLRTQIQHLRNTHFIFSGSRQHTLIEMFTSAKRPFYTGTRLLSLSRIDRIEYKQFIKAIFETGNKSIDDECIDYILDWTRTYTFYTQSVCNRAYSLKKADLDTVKRECQQLLLEYEPVYFQYRNLLTTKQWDFLIALAKEEDVVQVYSVDFLGKYQLGTPSAARRIIEALLSKEMILEMHTAQHTSYSVYDMFFMRWLQSTY
jgi:uncharacterized protein